MAEPRTINVHDYFTECISLEDGIELKSNYEEEVFSGKKVILDFSNIDFMLTAFFNGCVGPFVEQLGKEKVDKLIIFEPVDNEYLQELKQLVLENAVIFYQHKLERLKNG